MHNDTTISTASDLTADDVQGYAAPVGERAQRPPAGPPTGGLYPYNINGPTISNGYIFPNGTRYPY